MICLPSPLFTYDGKTAELTYQTAKIEYDNAQSVAYTSAKSMLENLSLEIIMDQDPDFIFAVVQGSDTAKAEALLDAALLSHPAWASLRAVREGRFHVMDQRLYNVKPNADWGKAYEQLADILYS